MSAGLLFRNLILGEKKSSWIHRLGAIALFFMFITIVILGVTVGKLNHVTPYQDFCMEGDCLYEAASLLDFMNTSVDPCTNFYQYACGNFKTLHPPEGTYESVSVADLIARDNDKRLKDTLESSVKNDSQGSAEKKAKQFFATCIDEYQKTATGARPLITDLINLGGWYPLYGTFNVTVWNQSTMINLVLQDAHAQFGAKPFFKMDVQPDWTLGKRAEVYLIQFYPAKLGMAYWYDYLTNFTTAIYHRKGYRDFITSCIRLLYKDWNNYTPPHADELIADTIDDILWVETQIANITYGSDPVIDPTKLHQPIKYLNQNYKGKIDWSDLIITYFTGVNGNYQPITEETIINLRQMNYMEAINTLINSLTPRQINNYIMWRVAHTYITELGWEYIHINRVWSKIQYGSSTKFQGQYDWCLSMLKQNFGNLLSHLFVTDNFLELNRQQVQNIFDGMKVEFGKRIDKITWMDGPTKAEAKLKMEFLKDKIGYPSWVGSTEQINQHYMNLVIASGFHYSNMKNIAQFKRAEACFRLQLGKVTGDFWFDDQLFNVNARYNPIWNDLYLPAGLLQKPIYDPHFPQYLNFAALGRYVGEYLTRAIDTSGRYSDHNGHPKKWWSKQTTKNWNDVTECNNNQFLFQQWCYTDKHGYTCSNITNGFIFGPSNWRDLAALGLVESAYQNYISENGPEQILPGLQAQSIKHLSYLAFAQTFCVSEDPYRAFLGYEYLGTPISEILVNRLMQETESFADTFNCPSKFKVKSCQGF